MDNQNMAIAVVSFDKYSDVWDVFALCINKYWKDRPYKTYLITNDASPKYNGIEIVKTGEEVSWSYRVKKALETIREEYIMLLLEDYLISEDVDNDRVENALKYMKSNAVDYLRIAPIPTIKNTKSGEFATALTSNMVYGVNLQAAIWKRDYLLKVINEENLSAWEVEARQKFDSPTRIEGKCYATKDFIVQYLNGIIQGKWYIKTIEGLAACGIEVPLGERKVMTDKDMRRETMRNYLLHHIPPKVIRRLKPVAKKLGFKFVT